MTPHRAFLPLILTCLVLAACGNIIAADTQTTRAEKNLQPPRTATPTPPPSGFYAFNLDAYALSVEPRADGSTDVRLLENKPLNPPRPDPEPDKRWRLILEQPYRNPLPVQLRKHPDVAYLQYDDAGEFKKVWLLDQHGKPIPCQSLKACRWNLTPIKGE